MENFKVRVLESSDNKSTAQIEKELLEKHEQEQQQQQQQQQQQEQQQQQQQEQEQVQEQEEEFDEQKVLSYIGKRYNKQINSFNDLIAEREKSEELPADVAAYLTYKKETGRGIDDFIKLNKDYEEMHPEKLVKEYLTATQEGLDDEDIETLMDEYRYDEDLDDESKIKKVKIERKKIINDAKKFFNNQKEKYKIPLESSPVGISDDEKAEFNSYREYLKQSKTIEEENNRRKQWFDQKTNDVFSKEFKGFEFDVDGKKIVFSPGDSTELKRAQSAPQNFISKFLDENGLIKDAVGYHRSLAIAMNPEKFAKFFYEQGQADGVGNSMKTIKNINMSERRATEISKPNEGMQVKAINPDSGKSLKIRSIKRV